MPDLDILAKGIPSCFHVGYRLLGGGSPDDLVVPALARGLSEAVRRGCGLPGLRQRAEFLDAVASGALSPSQAAARSSDQVLREGGGRHAQIAHRTLCKLATGAVPQGPSAEPAERQLARAFCHELLDSSLLGRARPYLIGTRYEDAAACDRATAALHASLERTVTSLSDQLIVDSSGAAIRVPPLRRPPRRSTAEILEDPVT